MFKFFFDKFTYVLNENLKKKTSEVMIIKF